MDLLGTVLLTLRVVDASVLEFELAPPWGFYMPAMMGRDEALIFSPVDAPCWLYLDKQAPVRVDVGDFVLLLGGAAHTVKSDPDAPIRDLPSAWREQGLPEFSEPGERVPLRFRAPSATAPDAPVHRVLGLAIAIEDAERNAVLNALPVPVRVRRSAGRLFPWLPTGLQFLSQEGPTTTPGHEVTARHLATLIFSSLVRAHVVTEGSASGSWLRGLSDPQVGQALTLMHQKPGQPWTLASLAAACAMSRTGFARRFVTLVGTPPMAHLTDVRMAEAARQLIAGTPVGVVAGNVGYASDWAFRNAFTQRYGTTPRRFRSSRGAAPP